MRVVSLAFQIDHSAAGRRRQRVGKGLGFQSQLVHVMVERRGRHREPHAAQLGDDAFGAFKGLRAQAATHLRGFIHHGLEPEFHQLVGRHQARDPGADDRHFGAMISRRNTAQPGGVFDPVIKGKREVRAENGDGFLTVARVAIGLAEGAGRNAHG